MALSPLDIPLEYQPTLALLSNKWAKHAACRRSSRNLRWGLECQASDGLGIRGALLLSQPNTQLKYTTQIHTSVLSSKHHDTFMSK